MAEITTNNVRLSQTWGAEFGDYSLGSEHVDFQDIMFSISERRATSVER